jgi:hippurate hydrolase
MYTAHSMLMSTTCSGRLKHISAYHEQLTRIRRDLHAHPELGFEEVRTGGVVAGELQHYGVDEVHRGIGRTGLVAVVRGQRHDSGKTIGLRADMDALPMREENSFDHASTRQGLMHGCGHDGHTTMLLGAARYLAATRNFNGTAHLIFQPGEEGFGGAREMIQDGLFERFPCDAVYAMHNWPNMPPGTLGVNNGPMMAAADRITITVHGKGGHGAHAYQAIDPVLISAHIITALQGVVSRSVKATDSAVLSICAVQAGDMGAMSVIPSHAKLVGTVRTFRPEVQDLVEQRIKDTACGVAQAFGGTVEVNFERIYPATINSAAEAQFAGDVAAELMGEDKVVRNMEPSMGAEDFSFMLQVRPGAYMRLGQGAGPNNCFLHNPRYDFNDAVLPLGAALFAGLVEKAMPL